jgi:adenosylcobinamide-phosphate synthase
MSGLGLLAGYAADLAWGDPRRGHPVAAFGHLALALEARIYAPTRARGALYTTVLVATAAVAGELLARGTRRAGFGRTSGLVLVTWSALGGRSLIAHAREVSAELTRDPPDLPAARRRLPALVGRDPAGLDALEIARAVVESIAENTSDAVLAPLLWGAAAGPAGVAAYRAANTLDAMVGRRDERYERFGWASARLDDVLNWPAARVGAALTVALAPIAGGDPRQTWATVRRDGARHPSPNAGRMEAAFAGALGVELGGPLAYAGHREDRPTLGDGRRPQTADIERAARLSLAIGALAAVLIFATEKQRVRALRSSPPGRRHHSERTP